MRIRTPLFIMTLTILCVIPALSTAAMVRGESLREISAAYGVIGRVLPDYRKDFRLEIVKADSGKDMFEVEASHGIVTVRGNSAISLTRGVYFYLREATHSQYTWEGEHLDLPKVLPDFKRARVVSPYEYRLYYNVCAFGYTTTFWDWKQWQR